MWINVCFIVKIDFWQTFIHGLWIKIVFIF